MEDLRTYIVILLCTLNCLMAVQSRQVDSTELPLTWSTQSTKNSESLEDELQSLNQTVPISEGFFSIEEDDDDDVDSVESFDDELDDIGQQRERPSEESEDDKTNDIIVTTLVPTVLTEEETRVDEPTDKGPAEPTKEHPESVTGIMNDSYQTTSPTASESGEKSSEEDKLKSWKENSQDEKLLNVKELKPDDYIDDDPAEVDEADNDDFFTKNNDHMIEAKNLISEGKKERDSGDNILNRTKKELREVLYETGLFSRQTRNARSKGLLNSANEEKMLDFLIGLSKKPQGWARVTEILGKMDYDQSSRLKTALQMEALGHEEKSHNIQMEPERHQPKSHKTSTFSLLPAKSYSSLHNENNVLKAHALKPNDNFMNLQNRFSAQKMHGNKISKDNEMKQNEKWHTTNSKIYNKAYASNSFDFPMQESDFHHLAQHSGPINTIAVDVPGNSFLSNSDSRRPHDSNKQAYIAVSIYKPNKQNYHRVDGAAKTNTYPIKVPPSTPSLSSNKNFRYDIPIMNQRVSYPTQTPKNSKNKNKFPTKVKNGNKNRSKDKQFQRKQKQKLKQKQKQNQKNQRPTDEIEAQLMALSTMEQKLKQQMNEKEKLRQSLRTRHRTTRSSFM